MAAGPLLAAGRTNGVNKRDSLSLAFVCHKGLQLPSREACWINGLKIESLRPFLNPICTAVMLFLVWNKTGLRKACPTTELDGKWGLAWQGMVLASIFVFTIHSWNQID